MDLSPQQWERVKQLYESALDHTPADRPDFLQSIEHDATVRDEVLRLLTENDSDASFLSSATFRLEGSSHALPQTRFAPEQLLADRFRIVRFIAAGGMGEVYEAEDLTLKENVAIKTIRPEVMQQGNALARFKREVQLARKVTHPNICRVFDLFLHKPSDGHSDDAIFFVSMELLQGWSLSEFIRGRGRLQPAEASPLITQIAAGLEAAHRAGVVHRDLKPGNIMLVSENAMEVRCVITDFGLAFRAASDANQTADLTASRGFLGTPAYMAPEQFEGKEVTKLTDIYALGLIIYEMVTGQDAFPANTPLVAAAKKLSESVVSPKRFAPDLSANWEQTILRCLRRDPTSRISSALEVAKALSGGESVLSRLDKLGSPTASPAGAGRRNRLFVAMGIVLIALLIAATILVPKRGVRTVGNRSLIHKQISFTEHSSRPAISPDGSFIAFVNNVDLKTDKLVLRDLSGEQTLEILSAQSIGDVRWSPDGADILAAVQKVENDEPQLVTISRLGGSARVISRAFGAFCPLNESQIVVATFDSSENAPDKGIWLIEKQTGVKKRILAPSYESLYDIDCNAGRILLLTEESGKYQIWTFRSDGSDLKKAFEEPNFIKSPRWSPLGDAIYFLRTQASTMDFVKLPLSNHQAAAVLVSGLEAGDYFTIANDGSQVAYTRTLEDSKLWSFDLSNWAAKVVRPKQLTVDGRSYDSPGFSPDGRSIAVVISTAESGSGANIYKMSVDGGQPTQLTFFNSTTVLNPAWSPDGKRIAFIRYQAPTAKVWVMNNDGSELREFTKTNAIQTSLGLAWFPSEDIIYQKALSRNLLALNPETEKEEQLLSKDSDGWIVFKPRVSPDGKVLAVYWNRSPHSGLWLLDRDSGSARLLAADQDLLSTIAAGWSHDGKYVYATQWGGRRIFRVEVQNGKQTKMNIDAPGAIRSATVSPDDRTIVFNATEEKSDIWIMKNFDPN